MSESLEDERFELPEAPVQRLIAPVVRFLHVEAAAGVVLLGCTALALILANSPLAEAYAALWKTPIGFQIGGFEMVHSLKHWVSDALMAMFFFVVGLEVKRELVLGELRDVRRAALPIAAAIGGMLVPALVYLLVQPGGDAARGWGIPMATDIAFVVGCMAILGSRIPLGLRVMVLSLAIADDIGAILVIAVGYTSGLDLGMLALGALGIALVSSMERLGVRAIPLYFVVGGFVWLCFHESGVHATIAGVILGLMTPARSWVSRNRLGRGIRIAGRLLRGAGWDRARDRRLMARQIEIAAREALSPLERLENALHPWSSFVIMPIFALANAGVAIEFGDLENPVASAVVLGLLIGKPIGIVAFSAMAVRLGLARLPDGVGWSAVAGAGFLCGIGFTMSLFIAGLALEGDVLDAAKVGILLGSALSAALGMILLLRVLPPSPPAASGEA